MSADMLPVVLALTSGFLFALGVQFQHIALSEISSRSGTAISITTSAVLYWLLAPFISGYQTLSGIIWAH